MSQNLTTHAQGHKRDLQVLAHLGVCKLLSQEQIHLLEFWNVSKEMSHRCTKRLAEKDHLIRRVKMSWSDSPDWFHLYDEKRPDQIQHRLGKAWLYTSLIVRTMEGSEEKLIYYKDEETKFLEKYKLKIDGYCKTVHAKWGIKHYFGEFHVSSSPSDWNKNYISLFNSFSGDQSLTLIVITVDNYTNLKKRLVKEFQGMRNVTLAFYTLEELGGLCWKIALKAREKFKNKELFLT